MVYTISETGQEKSPSSAAEAPVSRDRRGDLLRRMFSSIWEDKGERLTVNEFIEECRQYLLGIAGGSVTSRNGISELDGKIYTGFAVNLAKMDKQAELFAKYQEYCRSKRGENQ